MFVKNAGLMSKLWCTCARKGVSEADGGLGGEATNRWVDALTLGPAQEQQTACRASGKQKRDRDSGEYSRGLCPIRSEPQ